MLFNIIYFSIEIDNWKSLFFSQVFAQEQIDKYQLSNFWRSICITGFVSGFIFYNRYMLKVYKTAIINLAAILSGIPETIEIL